MAWTIDRKVFALFDLPWTLTPETTPEGDHLIRVAEIPSAVGCGETEEAAVNDLLLSMESSFRAYLEHGDAVPLPEGSVAPWEPGARQSRHQTVLLGIALVAESLIAGSRPGGASAGDLAPA